MTQHTPGAIDFDALNLDKGNHIGPDEGHRLLEVVSMFAGEPFGDSPKCVCPALASFGRAWNDRLDDERRQSLKRYVPLLLNTNEGRALSVHRAYMAADWAARTCLPAYFDTLPQLAEHAATLRALAPITDKPTAREAQSALALLRRAAADAAYAAYAAAADAEARQARIHAVKAEMHASQHDLYARMIAARLPVTEAA